MFLWCTPDVPRLANLLIKPLSKPLRIAPDAYRCKLGVGSKPQLQSLSHIAANEFSTL